MEKYTYNFEISTLLAQFLDAFDDVVIKRWDRSASHSKPTQKGPDIRPTIRYSPKQRIIEEYINNQAKMRLPVICFTISSLSRDSSRVFNKITGPQFNQSTNNEKMGISQPVPVNLVIKMDILSKYQEDIDQIITNFIPYLDDYIAVSWTSPYLSSQEIRSIIQWDGSMGLEYPTDTRYSDQFRITGSTSFTIKGWLFKAESESPIKAIHNIYTHIHAVSGFYCDQSVMQQLTSAESSETEVISGRPLIKDVSPYFVFPCKPTKIIATGDMFDFTTEYYLSGGSIIESAFYDFSGSSFEPYITSLSGIKIEPTILTENVLEFVFPALSSTGFVDFIAINDAGISYLTKDCLSQTYNNWQPPCVNGIEVINNFIYCE